MRGEANKDTVQKNAAKLDAAANASATITVAAIANEYHVLRSVDFSYDGTPTGQLSVSFGSPVAVIKERVDVVTAGPQNLQYPRGLYRGATNEPMEVSLVAGGSGVTGKVSITYK